MLKRDGCRLEWPKDHYFPARVLTFREGWEPPALPSATASREQELTQLAESLANAETQRREELQVRVAPEVGIDATTRYFLRTNRKQVLMSDFLFVFAQQSAVQMFPPADGYAFSNTSYKRMQILDQAVSRHVDR